MEEFGYGRVKFADPLKSMYRAMLRDIGHTPSDIERYVEGDLKTAVIDGLDEIGVVSRSFMIDLGTAFGRRIVHPDFWVHLWAGRLDFLAVHALLSDDLRFPNEEAALKRRGGMTIHVTRPGVAPAAFKWRRLGPWLYGRFGCMWGVHDSERIDRLRPHHVIVNDGSIEELRAKVRALAESVPV
jgi:hypothetical protein